MESLFPTLPSVTLTHVFMTGLYRNFIRPFLFSQDSESIHNATLGGLNLFARNRQLTDALSSFFGADPLPVERFGLRFPNPVGLAAGMDKFATAVPAWAAMGFGFSELGGVTRLEQPGNPAPRMFRVVEDQALINRMGFNNPGAAALAASLAAWKQRGLWPDHPVGINLGKSKATPLEEAAEDYLDSFKMLRPHADFFVVNVSSPNTPNLRQLQDKSSLDAILSALQAENARNGSPIRPILVKIAPDLSFEALDDILELSGPREIAGIVATNTTLTRPETRDARAQATYSEAGGLSGAPLKDRATACIRHISRQTDGALPVIGVGGVFSAEDAWEKITAGASLVQVYTGLVYEGPGIARSIVEGLIERLDRDGFDQLSDAVGTAA